MNLKLDTPKIIILVLASLCIALAVGLGLTVVKNKDLEGKLSAEHETILAKEATIATLTKDGVELAEKITASEESVEALEAELASTKAALELAMQKKKTK
jgi:predicted  nucleic acid-binding Zn-ribbon protein